MFILWDTKLKCVYIMGHQVEMCFYTIGKVWLVMKNNLTLKWKVSEKSSIFELKLEGYIPTSQ